MLTLEEAESLALRHMADVSAAASELVVLDEDTIVKPYGWVLCLQSKAYAASRDFINDALVGLGPIVVRHDGKVDVLSSAGGVEETIAAFEKTHGLRSQ